MNLAIYVVRNKGITFSELMESIGKKPQMNAICIIQGKIGMHFVNLNSVHLFFLVLIDSINPNRGDYKIGSDS